MYLKEDKEDRARFNIKI